MSTICVAHKLFRSLSLSAAQVISQHTSASHSVHADYLAFVSFFYQLGSSIMVKPVMNQGSTSVQVYMPGTNTVRDFTFAHV